MKKIIKSIVNFIVPTTLKVVPTKENRNRFVIQKRTLLFLWETLGHELDKSTKPKPHIYKSVKEAEKAMQKLAA